MMNVPENVRRSLSTDQKSYKFIIEKFNNMNIKVKFVVDHVNGLIRLIKRYNNISQKV